MCRASCKTELPPTVFGADHLLLTGFDVTVTCPECRVHFYQISNYAIAMQLADNTKKNQNA